MLSSIHGGSVVLPEKEKCMFFRYMLVMDVWIYENLFMTCENKHWKQQLHDVSVFYFCEVGNKVT